MDKGSQTKEDVNRSICAGKHDTTQTYKVGRKSKSRRRCSDMLVENLARFMRQASTVASYCTRYTARYIISTAIRSGVNSQNTADLQEKQVMINIIF